MRKVIFSPVRFGSIPILRCLWGIGLGILLACLPGPMAVAAPPITVENAPPIIIDNEHKGTSLLVLRNKTGDKLKKGGVLSATDFINRNSRLGSQVLFSTPNDQNASMFYTLSEEIPPGEYQILKVRVSNIWQMGESVAEVLYNGEKIGTLTAVRHSVPFAVDLQENQIIDIKWGEFSSLKLKNGDLITYPVTWELAFGEKKISNVAALVTGTQAIHFQPPSEWFSVFRGMFKEDIRDGLLTLKYPEIMSPKDLPLYVKTIPVKARLSKWPIVKQILSTGVILLLLFMGGACSLATSYYVPNRLRRRDLIEQLEGLAGRIRDISGQIDSSIRVLMRVERKRLMELLDSRFSLSPDIATIFAQCAQGITTLNRQVILLGEIDKAYNKLEIIGKEGEAPPSLLDDVERKLREAEDSLHKQKPEEGDFKKAEGLITNAEALLAAIGQADPGLAHKLADRVSELLRVKEKILGNELLNKVPKYMSSSNIPSLTSRRIRLASRNPCQLLWFRCFTR